MARRYRYLDEAKYPPFNPNVPVTTDISDQEKRNRGMWHIQNARRQGLDRSILISAFNDAKARGLSDNQAYEYVRDVAASKGWSEQGGYDIGQRTFQTAKQVGAPALHQAVNEDKQRVDRLANFSKRLNSGLSAIGTGISFIPGGRAAGLILQLPDVVQDSYDAFTNPSVANGVDVAADLPAKLFSAQIPGYVDDIARGISGVYDAYTAIRGKSPAEDVEQGIKKRKSIKRTKGR